MAFQKVEMRHGECAVFFQLCVHVGVQFGNFLQLFRIGFQRHLDRVWSAASTGVSGALPGYCANRGLSTGANF